MWFGYDSVMIVCYVSLSECLNIVVNVMVIIMMLVMFVLCVYFKIWIMSKGDIDVVLIFVVMFSMFVIIICLIVL